MARFGRGGEEEGFAVVREFEAGERWRGGVALLLGCEHGAEVEGCEGGFVVVAQVVEEDAVGTGAGDGDDCCGGIVGG